MTASTKKDEKVPFGTWLRRLFCSHKWQWDMSGYCWAKRECKLCGEEEWFG